MEYSDLESRVQEAHLAAGHHDKGATMSGGVEEEFRAADHEPWKPTNLLHPKGHISATALSNCVLSLCVTGLCGPAASLQRQEHRGPEKLYHNQGHTA